MSQHRGSDVSVVLSVEILKHQPASRDSHSFFLSRSVTFRGYHTKAVIDVHKAALVRICIKMLDRRDVSWAERQQRLKHLLMDSCDRALCTLTMMFCKKKSSTTGLAPNSYAMTKSIKCGVTIGDFSLPLSEKRYGLMNHWKKKLCSIWCTSKTQIMPCLLKKRQKALREILDKGLFKENGSKSDSSVTK